MIKGKRIQTSSITVVVPLKNIKNMKHEEPKKLASVPPTSSLTKIQKPSQQEWQNQANNAKIECENIQNRVNQQRTIAQSKVQLNEKHISHTHHLIHSKITLNSSSKATRKKFNPAKYKQQEQKEGKNREKQLSRNAKIKDSKGEKKIKNKPKEINGVGKCKEKKNFLQMKKAQVIQLPVSETQSEELQRQIYPIPIIAHQTQQQSLLIDQQSSVQSTHQLEQNVQLDFDYSFFPQKQEEIHQDHNLPLNMDVFQLTAEQILALDYFPI